MSRSAIPCVRRALTAVSASLRWMKIPTVGFMAAPAIMIANALPAVKSEKTPKQVTRRRRLCCKVALDIYIRADFMLVGGSLWPWTSREFFAPSISRDFHGELQPIEGKSREIDGAKNSLEVQGHRDPPTSIKSALMYISNATLQHSRRLRVTCLGVFSDLTAGSAFAIMIVGAAMKPTVGIFIHRNDAETAVKA